MKALLMTIFLSTNIYAIDCAKEMEKLCSGAKGSFADCIKTSTSKLPAKCRSDVQGLENMSTDLGALCMSDIMKYCPITMEDIDKDPKIVSENQSKCMKANKNNFSKKCSKLIDDMAKAFGGKFDNESGVEVKKIE